MNQFTRLNVPNLNEAGLERKDIRIIQRKRLRCSFPGDFPVLSCTPSIPIDEEAEVGIIEKEFSIEALDMDRFDVFSSSDEIKRGIGLVE